MGDSRADTRARIGLWLAPAVGVTLWFVPLELEPAQQRLLAIFVTTIVLWVCETLPLAATALLIGPAMTMAGVTDAKSAFAPYAAPLLFVFVGGFMIARAMTRHGLDRRIALNIVSARMVQGSAGRVRAAFVVAGALLSMWISNTATAAILTPILMGLFDSAKGDAVDDKPVVGGLLCVAYTCSIGGLGTPVGSPPNLIAMNFLREAGVRIAFFDWVAISIPLVAVMLVGTLLWMNRLYPLKNVPAITVSRDPRPWTKGEFITAVAFATAIIGWMTPGLFKLLDLPGADALSKHLHSGAVAMVAATLLFLFRDDKGERVLDWPEATKIDWGIIMLFGGGISLGKQMFDTGLAEVLSKKFVELTGVTDLWVLTGLVALFTIFFTETCSNTATSNMLSPLVIAIAAELGVSPIPPVLAVGLAASCAFMLPIATGPNAVVYGSGRVTMPDMIGAGFGLNLFCVVVIVVGLRLLCPLFGWT